MISRRSLFTALQHSPQRLYFGDGHAVEPPVVSGSPAVCVGIDVLHCKQIGHSFTISKEAHKSDAPNALDTAGLVSSSDAMGIDTADATKQPRMRADFSMALQSEPIWFNLCENPVVLQVQDGDSCPVGPASSSNFQNSFSQRK